jgi:hypothetical protein
MPSFTTTDTDHASDTKEEEPARTQENGADIPTIEKTQDAESAEFAELPEEQHKEDNPYAFEDLQQLSGALGQDDELLQSFKNLRIEETTTRPIRLKYKKDMGTTSPDKNPIRKSKKIRPPSKKLIDHLVYNIMTLESRVENEPKNYAEVCKNKELVKGMENELESIEKNKTWTLVDPPLGCKPVKCK